jgi:tyrosyl-tRNA synthetase
MTSREDIAETILNRGVITDIIPDKESFRKRLLSQEPMKIYIGADATAPKLHLGHAQNYMILEEIRQLGHEVIVLFGDFTARIGDPSDRMSARSQLSADEANRNVEKWVEQIRPLMDFDAEDNPPRILFNSDWLSNLSMQDVVELASNTTVQRMLERDMFVKRMEAETPIHLHEFLYPLMQGYDSVALDIDAELCGTDQTFNALVGRTLLDKLRNKDKLVVATRLLQNPKTGELMSKSRGTGVFLDNGPFDLFGAVMEQPDEMVKPILVSNTRIPLDEIDRICASENPRDAKMRAAFEVTRIFHGEEKATSAQEKFVALVQRKDTAEDLPQVTIEHQKPTLFQLVRNCLGGGTSNSEVRRLIRQGAVKVDGSQRKDTDQEVEVFGDGVTVKVGKKRWFKVTSS